MPQYPPLNPMADENFDIELDVVYEYNSQVTDFVISNPANSPVRAQNNMPGAMPYSLANVPTTLPIPHGWRDNVVFRLGGDVNVIPGFLAIRAGTSVEVPVNRGYVQWMTNDYISGWRVGLHVGGTIRIDNRFDLSIAYAHLFAETIVVGDSSATAGNSRLVAAMGNSGACTPTGSTYDASNPVSSRGCFPSGFGSVINNGTYWQGFDVISLAGTYHFD